ncbi:glutamyl-tRNA synthetase [Croceibacterium mercuriale]|uniref:Glutamyl-tRNA synthetase n=1 Tax=Croceibacterium mercuriale TaxID=1572751 RepID=A0A0B2BSG8_9SPHN|nr:HIG1 domain-containing protein [Croceibacterium mercuriale]KHL24523.1 glutamyl-tRNA synthetase [Croceibacterium mercuriale]
MNTFLVIVIIILAVLVVVSMVRGIVAFMQTTKIDLESGDSTNLVELQERQNKMMFNRIKYQALAIVVVALLLLFNR